MNTNNEYFSKLQKFRKMNTKDSRSNDEAKTPPRNSSDLCKKEKIKRDPTKKKISILYFVQYVLFASSELLLC